MFRRCYYCNEIFGEKPPFENHEETSGECPLCHWLFSIWYALYREDWMDQKAIEFILDCRKAIGSDQESLMLPDPLDLTPKKESLGDRGHCVG